MCNVNVFANRNREPKYSSLYRNGFYSSLNQSSLFKTISLRILFITFVTSLILIVSSNLKFLLALRFDFECVMLAELINVMLAVNES
jgi:hypothetical protein